MKLAVIPARGGSKRIPRKNIRNFCGKPIIAYSISAALESGCFDHVVVSTDDEEIAAVAREYGATTPFIRPPEFSNDYAGTIPVIKHAIEWFQKNAIAPEMVCCIYATSPFIHNDDLLKGQKLLISSDAEYAFSVTSYPSPIQRAMLITESGRMKMFDPENFNIRSQDLVQAYHDAAQFYWGWPSAFTNEVPIFSEASAPVLLPSFRVMDIDTMEDWQHAELMYKAFNS